MRTLVSFIVLCQTLLFATTALSGNHVSDADYASAKRIHSALEKYVKIDNEVYFKSYTELIDYGYYAKQLTELSRELNVIISSIKGENELQRMMVRYGIALVDAIEALEDICGKLASVSKHGMSIYLFDEYQADLQAYKQKAEKYQELGKALSQYMFGY